MGNPSDNKSYPPDQYCEECGTILIGDEVNKKVCEDCKIILDLPTE